MAKRLSENEKALAVSMYQHGIKPSAIAEGLGIGKTTIYGYLKAAGCPVHNEERSLASQRGAVVRAQRKAQKTHTLTIQYADNKDLTIKLLEHLMDEMLRG